MSRQPAFWFPDASGKTLDFTEVRRIKGEDAVRLTQLRLFNNDGFCLIVAWIWHSGLLLPLPLCPPLLERKGGQIK